jgi:hypothetical protein
MLQHPRLTADPYVPSSPPHTLEDMTHPPKWDSILVLSSIENPHRTARGRDLGTGSVSNVFEDLRTWLSRHVLIAQIAFVDPPRLASHRVRHGTAIGLPMPSTRRWE